MKPGYVATHEYKEVKVMIHTANASKRIENIFLISEICSQIKKISEYISQSKKSKLIEKNFLVPFAGKFDFN